MTTSADPHVRHELPADSMINLIGTSNSGKLIHRSGDDRVRRNCRMHRGRDQIIPYIESKLR
eukprot:8990185-Pyramimonas_sp.AAC.1